MALSSSSSLIEKRFKYDVFLSYRRDDTCNNFVDRLSYSLRQNGISVISYRAATIITNVWGKVGDAVTRAIEDSRFHIIVFSYKYASSSWYLNVLLKILECQKTRTDQTAYPVFYDVKPDQILTQSDSVSGRWRDALKEAACSRLVRWEFDGHEANFIKQLVMDILLRLSFFNSIDENLVGMETRVKDVVTSLEIGSEDVRLIGIKGMGGGGKTTLARAVFNYLSLSFPFEGKCFVENVRELSKHSMFGLEKLQKQVLLSIANDQNIVITSVSDGKSMMKKMMPSRRVLVVLDDVDDIAQLEALAGEHTWFKPGSRIIITTRNEQALIAHQVKFIHDVNLLSDKEAICLFSRHAFKRDVPCKGYEELSQQVVLYAQGLPLTIKVLGSFLCDRSDQREWVNAIESLKTIPLKETVEKLKMSYNGLENDHKEIFLDVACTLKGVMKHHAIDMLESCGFNAQIGLRVLEHKSLITISDTHCLWLHEHIEEMGMNIACPLHPNQPNRCRRLWNKEEVEDILVNDLGTEATRSIKLQNTDLHPTMIMKGLRKMKGLTFLVVDDKHRELTIHEVGQYLPNTLRFLYWSYYPFSCLPETFQANMLVAVNLYASNISQLWEGGERKVLDKLKFLYLEFSKLRTIDLGLTPNLEELNLLGCNDFEELHMPVELPKLKLLNLSSSKLSYLSLAFTPNLELLNLDGCSHFVQLHMHVELPKLKFLYLGSSKLSNLNLMPTPNLELLNLNGCNHFEQLHMCVELPKLKFLYLSGSKVSNLNIGLTPNIELLNLDGCNDLVQLHMSDEFQKLNFLDLTRYKASYPYLEELHLDKYDDFVELHMPIEFSKLKFLCLNGSKLSNFNLGLTPNLERLLLEECVNFVELYIPVECPRLIYLNLSGSKLNNFNMGLTPHLEVLDLRGCNNFMELHMSVKFPKLKFLYLSFSKLSTLNLGLTPNLEVLDLRECKNFVELQSSDTSTLAMPIELPKLRYINLSGSKVINLKLGLTPRLEDLYLEDCDELVELHMSTKCLKLKCLDLSGSKLINFDLGLTPYVEEVHLKECDEFVELHLTTECPNLKYLYISGSKVSSLILGLAPCLEKLYLKSYDDFVKLHMPFECPKLKILHVSSSTLSNFDLGLTPHLEELNLKWCDEFEELYMPIECPKLKCLILSGSKVRNLNLGLTPHVEELNLKGCDEFIELHMSIELPKLKYLNLSGSKLSNFDLGLTPHLEKLKIKGCCEFVKLHMPVECRKLKYLNLSGSKVRSLKFGLTPYLEELHLEECDEFVELYMPIECPKLKYLNLSGSKVRSLKLGVTPYLEELHLRRCHDFEELDIPDECPNLKRLNLTGSKLSNFDLERTPRLEELDIKDCREFMELRMPIECPTLNYLNLSGSKVRSLKLGSTPYLKWLFLEDFDDSLDLHMPIECPRLIFLYMAGSKVSNLKLGSTLEKLESLTNLTLSMKEIKHLPDSICMLKNLESLHLKSCWLLEQLPNDLDKLVCLKELYLTDCRSLRDIPSSICNMKCLEKLHLPYCILVKKLPEEVGRLECLEDLNIEGTGISHLPQSIFQLERLHIVWSRGRLLSYGFTSWGYDSEYTASCRIGTEITGNRSMTSRSS